MEHAHVIAALRAKRDALAGELRQVKERGAQLRVDLQTIDNVIRIFDLANAPAAPAKPPQRCPHGRFSRAVPDTLRRAEAPYRAARSPNGLSANAGWTPTRRTA